MSDDGRTGDPTGEQVEANTGADAVAQDAPAARPKKRRLRRILNLAVIGAAVGAGVWLAGALDDRRGPDTAAVTVAEPDAPEGTSSATDAPAADPAAPEAPAGPAVQTADSGDVLRLTAAPAQLQAPMTVEPAVLRFSETGEIAEEYTEYEVTGTARLREFEAGSASWRAPDGEEFIVASLAVRNVSAELSPVVTLVVGDRRERLASLPAALAVAVPVGFSDVALEVAVGATRQLISLVDGSRDGDVRRVFDRDPASLVRPVGVRYDEVRSSTFNSCKQSFTTNMRAQLEVGLRLDSVELKVQRETTSQTAPVGEVWLVANFSEARYQNGRVDNRVIFDVAFDTEFDFNLVVTPAATEADPSPDSSKAEWTFDSSSQRATFYAAVPETIEDFTLSITPRSDWRYLEGATASQRSTYSLCRTGSIELPAFSIDLDLR